MLADTETELELERKEEVVTETEDVVEGDRQCVVEEVEDRDRVALPVRLGETLTVTQDVPLTLIEADRLGEAETVLLAETQAVAEEERHSDALDELLLLTEAHLLPEADTDTDTVIVGVVLSVAEVEMEYDVDFDGEMVALKVVEADEDGQLEGENDCLVDRDTDWLTVEHEEKDSTADGV